MGKGCRHLRTPDFFGDEVCKKCTRIREDGPKTNEKENCAAVLLISEQNQRC